MQPEPDEKAPQRRTRAERVTVAVLWLAALVTIAAIRIASPPLHSIDRRIDTGEMVDLFRWLAEIPLVASAIVTTVVWVVWRRGWWLYQLTLLLMSASVIFKAAMADWSRASYAIEPYPVPIRWAIERSVRIVWSTVRHEWDYVNPFVPFTPYLLVLGAAAIAPLATRLVRSHGRSRRVDN